MRARFCRFLENEAKKVIAWRFEFHKHQQHRFQSETHSRKKLISFLVRVSCGMGGSSGLKKKKKSRNEFAAAAACQRQTTRSMSWMVLLRKWIAWIIFFDNCHCCCFLCSCWAIRFFFGSWIRSIITNNVIWKSHWDSWRDRLNVPRVGRSELAWLTYKQFLTRLIGGLRVQKTVQPHVCSQHIE